MLLKAIDEEKYLKRKINVLIEAICILLYDNIVSLDEFSEQENIERKIIADKVIPILFQNALNKFEIFFCFTIFKFQA